MVRIAFVLPGLHRVVRGAEVAFEAIAKELSQYDDCEVTLFGSGYPRDGDSYRFIHVGNLDRKHFEQWPQIPIFRTEYVYEEFTFALNFLAKYRPQDFDVTITCSYPWLNWILRGLRPFNLGSMPPAQRPAHVFVTQNSDYPVVTESREYQFFDCEGLICTNPEYFENSHHRWQCELITNGVDSLRFHPGSVDRTALDLPENVPLALMVSALIPSKRILAGIEAAAEVPELHLLICGDGPERDRILMAAEQWMPGRLHLRQFAHQQMPEVYRAADVFLHLSLDEPFGNVYLEALATGLPVVAHDRAVTRWILEDTAVLVDSQESAQIAQGLQQALRQRSEADCLARTALVERRFGWPQIGQRYYAFIQDLIQQPQMCPA